MDLFYFTLSSFPLAALAVAWCTQTDSPCEFYAVDDAVVWKAE